MRTAVQLDYISRLARRPHTLGEPFRPKAMGLLIYGTCLAVLRDEGLDATVKKWLQDIGDE